MVASRGNTVVSESLPERVHAGMSVGKDKLRICTIAANRANDGLGLAAAGRRFHETGRGIRYGAEDFVTHPAGSNPTARQGAI